MLVPLVVVGATWVVTTYLAASRVRGEMWLALYSCLAPALLGYGVFATLRQPSGFIAVGPCGLVLCFRNDRRQHYARRRIGRSRFLRCTRAIAIEIDGRSRRFAHRRFFANDPAEARHCVAWVNAFAKARLPSFQTESPSQ